MALHDLHARDVAELTGMRLNTVQHWCSGKQLTIPAATLRLLAYDLKARVSA